jgi:hypothetical protein
MKIKKAFLISIILLTLVIPALNILNQALLTPNRNNGNSKIKTSQPGAFTLTSDADNPDLDGTFLLSWTDSENVNYYRVYFDTEFISEIDGSQTMLATGYTETNYPINDYPTGTYYFIIEALNMQGAVLSNCIQVNVLNSGPPRISSIYDGLYLTYSFYVMGEDYGTLTIDYTYLSGNIFLVDEASSIMGPLDAYHVNKETRFITDIGYGHLFFGSRPVYWIFANQELGDLVNIGVDGEGDHVFNITGQTGVVLPTLGSYTAWTLEDLSGAMALTLYDNETGILLDAIFYYDGGAAYYSLTLIDTNYSIIEVPPSDFVLGSDAESPELDGDFNLNWTTSDRADNYSVYQSSSFITIIDGSVTLLAEGLTTLTYAIADYTPGTYYFIVEAINNFGETFSNCIQIVVETGEPPGDLVLGSDAESPEIDGDFNLNWNISVGADNYSVYQSSSYITTIDGSVTLLAEGLTTLAYAIEDYTPDTYYFIVVAENEFGETLSNCIQIVVEVEPEEPPGDLELGSDAESPELDGDFDLVWNVSAGADNYSVYQSFSFITVIDGSVVLLAEGLTTLTYAIEDYAPGTYYFIVQAINDIGETLSNCIQIVVEVEPEEPPGDLLLGSDAESPELDGDFNLNWNASNGADNYSVYQSSSFISIIDGNVTLLAEGLTTLTYAIEDYAPGTYYFIVQAINDFGETLSNCIQIVVEVEPGEPPGDLELGSDAESPEIDGDFNLNWNASAGADNYSVYQSASFITTIDGSVTLLAEGLTTLLYAIEGYTPGTYYFIVVAENEFGETLSNCIQIVVEMEPGEPPGDLELGSDAESPELDGDFNLNWNASVGADNYSVYQSASFITTIDGSVTLLAEGLITLSYAIEDYTPGTYYFIVQAINDFGETLSNCLQIVVEVEPGEPPGDLLLGSDAESPEIDGDFNLNWNASNGADNYSVYQSSSFITIIDGSVTLLAEGLTTLSYAIEDYTPDTYYFILVAENEFGETLSNCIQIVVEVEPGEPPGDLLLGSTAESPELDGDFDLIWNASAGADNYSVYQSASFITTIDGSVTLLAEGLTTLSYAIEDYAPGTYYFIVKAINNFGETLSNCIQIVVEVEPGEPPGDLLLGSTAESPELDGDFDLVWNASTGADNYSVYQSVSFITIIDGSVTLLAEGLTTLSYTIEDYTPDTYYFIVMAENEFGETLSNCLQIVVEVEPGEPPGDLLLGSTAESPELDGAFYLVWNVSAGADNYSLYQSASFITTIDGSVTLLAEGLTTLLYAIEDYTPGTYYFIVVAENELGETLSNCIQIVVEVGTGELPEFIPGYEPFIILGLMAISILLLMRKIKKNI